MNFFLSISILTILLVIGKLIRVKIRIFQKLFIPASIIAGFIGIIFGKYILNLTPEWIMQVWSKIPGILINVVFAALFLGMLIPKPRIIWQRGGAQLSFGMVMGVGQYLVALLLAVFILKPLFKVPYIFSCILEVGFSGGHGTAAGMQSVFEKLGFDAGGALGQMSATIGILTAIIGGVFFINIAVRKGYCTVLNKNSGISKSKQRGLYSKEDQFSIATATVASESIEPLAFHFGIISIAVLIGWGMQNLIRGIHPILEGFPLFPLAMIGGIILQVFSNKTGISKYYDRLTFERLLGFALDLLVVAAIATIRLDLFIDNIWPFLILMAAGISWLFFVLVFFAPRMLPQNWVERGVTEFGMQSGVTAMGLLLLRLVDPQYKTDTASAFGFKQIIYEPFLGGGFITALSPFIIIQLGPVYSILVCLGIIVLFLFISYLNGWLRKVPIYKKTE